MSRGETAPAFVAARVRVTVDCPECAGPVPVNGIVPEVLCHGCQAVVKLEGALGWDKILTFGKGEGCMEHGLVILGSPKRALMLFLAFGAQGGELHRKRRGVLMEIDAAPPACTGCKHPLDVASLGREASAEGKAVDAFCPGCGAKIAIRAPEGHEAPHLHPACIAIVGETAPRGSLAEPPSTEKVMFSCLDCGAPSGIDGSTPRISKCAFCSASSYLPDALWLRLHPTQRKRAFHLILRADPAVLAQAKSECRA